MWEDREFSYKECKEEAMEEVRKRRIQRDDKIKPQKKLKAKPSPSMFPGPADELAAAVEGEHASPPRNPLAKGLIKSLTAGIAKANPLLVELQGCLATGSAADMEDYIPKKSLTAFTTLANNAEKAIGMGAQFLLAGVSTLDDPKMLNAGIKSYASELKAACEKLADYIAEMQADVAEAAEAIATAGKAAGAGA